MSDIFNVGRSLMRGIRLGRPRQELPHMFDVEPSKPRRLQQHVGDCERPSPSRRMTILSSWITLGPTAPSFGGCCSRPCTYSLSLRCWPTTSPSKRDVLSARPP